MEDEEYSSAEELAVLCDGVKEDGLERRFLDSFATRREARSAMALVLPLDEDVKR